jgi:HEAT repeat protein
MTQNFSDRDSQDEYDDLVDDEEQIDDPSAQNTRLEELADQWLAGKHDPANRDVARHEELFDVQLDEVLNRLIAAPQDLAIDDLRAFSDMSREQTSIVRNEWPSIAVDRRREVMRYLIQVIDEDITWELTNLFHIALDDEDSEVRRYAIEGLKGEISDPLVGPLVQILLNDPEVLTRTVAADALGPYVLAGELDELDSALAMRAEEALLSVVSRPEEPTRVRASALKSLAYSGETGLRQLIEDAYYAPEDDMRVSSLIAMGRSADVRWRSLVRAELQNPWDEMRAAAAQACGELETKAALDQLIELVSDQSHAVKVAAILALGRIGGRDAREVLEAVRLEEEEELVEAADFALEELMFFASKESELSLLEENEDALDDWDDIEPWHRGHDLDESDLGTYE